jgi:thiol-disulfide isomerase/thioredoxin
MDEAKAEFLKGVEIDMAKKTVDEILAPVAKDILRVSGSSGKNSYQTLVYKQPGEKEKKPVVVLFYDNTDRQGRGAPFSEYCPRAAIIFEALVREYKGTVRFVVMEFDSNPEFRQRFLSGRGDTFGITRIPSLAIYSLFDVVKGETPQKNDGKIKQVDIMRGGPVDDSGIFPNLRDARWYWIPCNLLFDVNIERNGSVYRLNNTWREWSIVGQLKK